MSQDQSSALPLPLDDAEAPSEEQVAAYLRSHPDFLARNTALLSSLAPPQRWSDDSVVDLQKAMVDTLKDELAGLRACVQDVIETSRSNMTNQARTHAAVLALLGADTPDRLVRVITDELPLALGVDMVVLALEPGRHPQSDEVEVRSVEVGYVDALIGGGQRTRLLGEVGLWGDMFGSGAELVKSGAFVRLDAGGSVPPGLLALGCRESGAFHDKQGTELLRFLAHVAQTCLHRLATEAA